MNIYEKINTKNGFEKSYFFDIQKNTDILSQI